MNLIPIRFLKGDANCGLNAGEIAGFQLHKAIEKVKAGIAEWIGDPPPEALALEAEEAAAAPAAAAPDAPISEAPAKGSEPEDPTPLDDDFPCRKVLAAAGIDTVGGIPREMDALMAIDGIGHGFAKKILAALEG